jgi:hypothetical protein
MASKKIVPKSNSHSRAQAHNSQGNREIPEKQGFSALGTDLSIDGEKQK